MHTFAHPCFGLIRAAGGDKDPEAEEPAAPGLRQLQLHRLRPQRLRHPRPQRHLQTHQQDRYVLRCSELVQRGSDCTTAFICMNFYIFMHLLLILIQAIFVLYGEWFNITIVSAWHLFL